MRIGSGWLVALAASSSLGCGATGLDWVGEPETARTQSDARDAAMSEPLPPGARSPRVELAQAPSDGSDDRPRLAHTVTLGGDAAPPGAGPAASAPADRGTTIVINNYTNVPSSYPAYAYGGGFVTSRFGSGMGSGVTRTSPAASSPSTIQPGQNWAPPAAIGPSFPYHLSPAPAWERSR